MAMETVSTSHVTVNVTELIRSHSMPVRSALYQLAVKVDDYLDDYGVIRRASNVSAFQRTKSSEDGELQVLAASTPAAEQAPDEANGGNVDTSFEPSSEPAKSADEQRARRKLLLARLHERKRELLRVQRARTQERLELWYEASELDPDVETSPKHTIFSPPTRAQSFVDVDGNIRRKSLGAAGPHDDNGDQSASASPPPSPSRQHSQSSAHKALVLEFVQAIIDD